MQNLWQIVWLGLLAICAVSMGLLLGRWVELRKQSAFRRDLRVQEEIIDEIADNLADLRRRVTGHGLELLTKENGCRCDFCGQTAADVKSMVAGPSGAICNACIDLCKEVSDKFIAEQRKAGIAQGGRVLSTPTLIEGGSG